MSVLLALVFVHGEGHKGGTHVMICHYIPIAIPGLGKQPLLRGAVVALTVEYRFFRIVLGAELFYYQTSKQYLLMILL